MALQEVCSSTSFCVALLTVLLRAVAAYPQEAQRQVITPSIILGLGPDACGLECDFVYNPLCGSDGNTYPNYCFLSRAACLNPAITALRYGACTSPDPCNFICDRSYNPVCGSDGRTYSNPCVLMYYSCYYSGSGLVRRQFGRCAADRSCPTTCSRTKNPVCGSDGRTYTNACTLQRAVCAGNNVFKVKNGPCTVCPRPCTKEYLPVCGSDGVTYPNMCVLQSKVCDGSPPVNLAYDGPCNRDTGTPQRPSPPRRPAATPFTPRPTSRRPFPLPNVPRPLPFFPFFPVRFPLPPTRPTASPTCPASCPAVYSPVCGSDGKTYGNECVLQEFACRDPNLTKNFNGECGLQVRPCPDVCPTAYSPVCGSDGITYDNDCALKAAACRDTRITMSSTGTCESVTASPACPDICPAYYDPVCGNDGRTYNHLCALQLAACRDPRITLRSNGECPIVTSSPTRPPGTNTDGEDTGEQCPNTCGRVYAPVCGSDGETYFNPCLLSVIACRENRPISVIREGRCDDPTTRSSSLTKTSSNITTTEDLCQRSCPLTTSPVCGSDGVTYTNECTFTTARCKDGTLTQLYTGHCKTKQENDDFYQDRYFTAQGRQKTVSKPFHAG